jgi:hypothetical protein
MGPLLSDIVQFADGLLDHWVAFATGSVLVMILGIWERAKNRTASFRFYVVVVLAFGFVVASFQTWRAEHAARVALQASPHWERSPDVARRLQQMYAEVSEFNRRSFAGIDGSNEDFKQLEKDVDSWSQENGKWILDNLGTAAYYRVIKNSGPLPESTDANHQQRLLVVLQIMQQNIGQLVESSAWDKR